MSEVPLQIKGFPPCIPSLHAPVHVPGNSQTARHHVCTTIEAHMSEQTSREVMCTLQGYVAHKGCTPFGPFSMPIPRALRWSFLRAYGSLRRMGAAPGERGSPAAKRMLHAPPQGKSTPRHICTRDEAVRNEAPTGVPRS